MHQSSFDKMKDFRLKYLSGRENEKLKIYDLGSQDVNGSYHSIFDSSEWIYKGIDMVEGNNVDIVLNNPYSWDGVKTNSADVVISGQAFEHIKFFWFTMIEIARVLKTGGICCIIAPSSGPSHSYPVDCWRFYSDGFLALAEFAGLHVLEAFTQWDSDPRYTEESNSNVWHDSVLICIKNKRSLKSSLKWKIVNFGFRMLIKIISYHSK